MTHGIALREEGISDVSLVTFHVFDKETQSGQRLACGWRRRNGDMRKINGRNFWEILVELVELTLKLDL